MKAKRERNNKEDERDILKSVLGEEGKRKGWRKSTKIFGTVIWFSIIITVIYFLSIYKDLTQLVLVLGFSASILLYLCLLLYEWIKDKIDDDNDRDEAIDRIRMWIVDEIEKINNKNV